MKWISFFKNEIQSYSSTTTSWCNDQVTRIELYKLLQSLINSFIVNKKSVILSYDKISEIIDIRR